MVVLLRRCSCAVAFVCMCICVCLFGEEQKVRLEAQCVMRWAHSLFSCDFAD